MNRSRLASKRLHIGDLGRADPPRRDRIPCQIGVRRRWITNAIIIKFGPPARTFKMNSGETSYIWQPGNQTTINTDRGFGTATTQFCKVSVIANKGGIVTQLNTEDANA